MVNKMALILFKLALPILLGYTMFVGISGQYTPFRWPKVITRRPLWFLGLWIGMATVIITTAGLLMAYRMDLDDLSTLVVPGMAIIFATLMPGIIGFFWYYWRVNYQISKYSGQQTEQQLQRQPELQLKQQSEQQIEQRSTNNIEKKDAKQFDNTLASNASAKQPTEETVTVSSPEQPETGNQQTIWAKNRDNCALSDLGLDETLMLDVDPAQYNEPALVDHADLISEANVGSAAVSKINSAEEEKIDTEVIDKVDSKQTNIEQNHNSNSNDDQSEPELSVPDNSRTFAQEGADLATDQNEIDRLHEKLESEVKTRKELEMHLRITRNGLGALESESRQFESNKATALIKIERELEEQVKRTSAAETRADREMDKRVELENQMVQLRADTLKATTNCRISTEARANALGTANKAATLARQAMKVRARLESQLNDAKDELNRKQTTISSLIKALEKEKSRTQKDVSSMAKQLRLHEKQLQARRTLEEVSRSVDNKLSTRLVKKVAKARS